MLSGYKSGKILLHHKPESSESSKVLSCITKDEKEKKYSNLEKLFYNLLNIKEKFVLKSYFDEESSKIFLHDKYESLKNIILDDTLPEDYKIIKTINLFFPPKKIIKKKINKINSNDFVSNLKNKINYNDQLKINPDIENNSNKSHRTIEWKIDSQFSFRYSNEKEE